MKELMPGVVDHGVNIIVITGTKPGGNVCVVDVNPADGRPRITLNDQSIEFPPGTFFWGLNYMGAKEGGDSFVLNLFQTATVTMLGGHNQVHSGPGWTTCYLHGDHNVYDCDPAGSGYVFSYGGPNDQIIDLPFVRVTREAEPTAF